MVLLPFSDCSAPALKRYSATNSWQGWSTAPTRLHTRESTYLPYKCKTIFAVRIYRPCRVQFFARSWRFLLLSSHRHQWSFYEASDRLHSGAFLRMVLYIATYLVTGCFLCGHCFASFLSNAIRLDCLVKLCNIKTFLLLPSLSLVQVVSKGHRSAHSGHDLQTTRLISCVPLQSLHSEKVKGFLWVARWQDASFWPFQLLHWRWLWFAFYRVWSFVKTRSLSSIGKATGCPAGEAPSVGNVPPVPGTNQFASYLASVKTTSPDKICSKILYASEIFLSPLLVPAWSWMS